MAKKKDEYASIKHKLSVTAINRDEANLCLTEMDTGGEILRYNFEMAFHTEKDRKYNNELFWALPSEERTYYIVRMAGNPILIASTNEHLNIASFSKVTADEAFKSIGKYCVKKFIEEVVVHKCKASSKDTCSAYAYTQRSTHVFEYLMEYLPEGIKLIEISGNGVALYVS